MKNKEVKNWKIKKINEAGRYIAYNNNVFGEIIKDPYISMKKKVFDSNDAEYVEFKADKKFNCTDNNCDVIIKKEKCIGDGQSPPSCEIKHQYFRVSKLQYGDILRIKMTFTIVVRQGSMKNYNQKYFIRCLGEWKELLDVNVINLGFSSIFDSDDSNDDDEKKINLIDNHSIYFEYGELEMHIVFDTRKELNDFLETVYPYRVLPVNQEMIDYIKNGMVINKKIACSIMKEEYGELKYIGMYDFSDMKSGKHRLFDIKIHFSN